MSAPDLRARPTSNQAGVILRRWRGLRGKSQLDLSAEADVSQRHISFVESGRSLASRQMLLDLAGALDMPLRERNTLLVAGGYAPVYPDHALDEPAMSAVHAALRRMLARHEPYPAVVMDRAWNVVLANEAAPRFFGCFVDLSARPAPRNLLHLVFDPEGLRPHLANWPEAGRALLARVQREALGHVVDIKTRRLIDELLRYPGVEAAWRTPLPRDDLPMVPLSFDKGGVTLSYFSMVATVGTPQALAAEELRLECLCPADDRTEREHERFVRENTRTRVAKAHEPSEHGPGQGSAP